MSLELIGVIGAVVIFLAHFPLYVKIVRKTVRPSLATWAMWSIMLGMVFASQVMAGKKDPWGMLAAACGTIAVFILLLFYGERAWSRFDTKCLVLAAIGIAIWAVTSAAVTQVAFLAAILTAGAPTVKNAWKNPENESALVWATFTVGFAMTTIAVPDWSNLTIWIQPVASTIFNSIVFTLATRREN